jgi:heptosyltransferase-2
VSANVLVQTAFLGDLLLSIPLMKKIKGLWPDQKLLLVCRKGIGEFFLKTGLVDQVFEIKKGDAQSYKNILAELQKHGIDKVFSPHESLRTAFFVRKIKAREKIAFSKPWNWLFYRQRIVKNYNLPDAIRQISLLQNLDPVLSRQIQTYAQDGKPYLAGPGGALSATPTWAAMNMEPFYKTQAAQIDAVLLKLQMSREGLTKSVALFPGSVWATKRWTEEGFVQTGRDLLAQGVGVLIMGGPGEEELCARVAAQIPGVKDLCGRTSIFESALVLSQVAAVMGNDSASMHLAATAGTPSVVIFGPTVLEFGFRPWQDKVYVVEKNGLACRPCGKHGHKVCPIQTHECMKSIQKNEVLKKLEEILR